MLQKGNGKYPTRTDHSMITRCGQGLPPPKGFPGGWGAEYHTYRFLLLLSLLTLLAVARVGAAPPNLYENNRMAVLRLPDDTEVNSIIYRLRAKDTDRDYPLNFKVGPIGRNIIYLNQHNCSRSNNIFCEADVYLGRIVEAGRVYKFDLSVIDTTGARTSVKARIDGTKGRVTPISDIFLKYSPAIRVKEDRPPHTVISTMIVRKKNGSPFGELHTLGDSSRMFKVMPGNLVSSDTINASILLENELNYDVSNLHLFQVCQLYPYTKEEIDTRNIACVSVAVMVEDVQDLPPMFNLAPPVTRVPSVAVRGDEIAKVQAEDRDKGEPREIRYSILPASSLYTHYFTINGRTGVISMNESAAIMRDKMVSLEPILMTVTAEEVTNRADDYPSLATSVEIAFVVLDAEILIPKFVHEMYVGEIYEDSLPDTQVYFDSPFLVQGVKGLFSLELEGDNGAFTVQPGVVKDASEIALKVKNSFLLDYETRPQIVFKLIARQVRGPQQVTGSAEITVKVLDTNDNVPKFSQDPYVSEIFENATRGTTVARIYATDEDTGPFGNVRYTSIYGPLSDRLYLNPTSGVVTFATDNHNFDRETASEYVLTVEAKDNNGQGASANVASAKLVIRPKDINDFRPRFEDSIYKGVLTRDLLRLREPIRVRATDMDAERPNNEVEYYLERTTYSDYFDIDKTTGYLDMKQNFHPLPLQPLKSGQKNTTELVRRKRQLDDSDSVINLRVRASDRGYPSLSGSVDVKIFKEEFGERVFKFIYPKPRSEVLSNKLAIEATLNDITGGTTEIKDVRQRRTGYLGTTIDPNRSEVTALVRFGRSAVVDLERVLSNMNNSEVHQLRTEKQKSEKVIKEIEGQNYSYLVGVVFLCLILATIVIVIILCCFCEGCPLYKDRKKYSMVSDDGSEGVSYIRVDENGKYRRNPETENPPWWDAMPRFMKNLFLFCGYVPNDRNSSRLAWSADERQRYWKMSQNEEHLVADRPMMRASRNPRDAVLLEDLDDGRFHRERLQRPGPYPRVESRTSQNSQEVRRVFLLKNAKEVAAKRGDSLREGEMYLIEDIDENVPNMRMEDGRNGNIMVHQEEDYQLPRQGNAEILRLHASPRDAVYFNGQMRRVRRAGMEPEGTVLMQEDPGGGLSSRLIEGQSVGQTPRSHREYYMEDRRGPDLRYAQNASPSQTDAYIQTDEGRGEHYASRKRIKSPIQEETRSLLDAERRSFKDKSRTKKALRSEVQKYIEKQNEQPEQRSKSSKSVRSANIPGTYGYQHTKTSILRYESNKAKLEEEREEMIRQGKDPDTCTHTGGSVSGGERSSLSTSRSTSKLEGRRTLSQNTLAPGTHSHNERRGSLPEVETTIEREAARRIQVRRNSAGGYERYEDMPAEYQEALIHHQTPSRDQVIYVNEAEKVEELERRRQQRRNEASEALSEELLRNHIQEQAHLQAVQDVRAVEGRIADTQYVDGPHAATQAVALHPAPSEIVGVHNNTRVAQSVFNENSNTNAASSSVMNNGERQSIRVISENVDNNNIDNSSSVTDTNVTPSVNGTHVQNVQRSSLQVVDQISSTSTNVIDAVPSIEKDATSHSISATSILPAATNIVGNNPAEANHPSANNTAATTNLATTSSLAANNPATIANLALSNLTASSNPNAAGNLTAASNPAAESNPQTNITNQNNQDIKTKQSETTQHATHITTTMTQEENNNTILQQAIEPEELINRQANLPDDAKSAHSAYRESRQSNEEALKIMEEEMTLGVTKSSKIFEKNIRNDKSVLNIPASKRKRSRMLEKKSVFTIAYDGMKTDQLRPESAATDP